jgi:hypothetical protein
VLNFPSMSTLSEIEAAVDKLPHPEQQILLEHLSRKLGARSTKRRNRGRNANAGSKSWTGCGTAGLAANRGCLSRRSSTISVVSVADELFGFFSAGKALRAGVGFRGVPRVGAKGKPSGEKLGAELSAPQPLRASSSQLQVMLQRRSASSFS